MNAIGKMHQLKTFEDAVLQFMKEGIRSLRRLTSTVLAADPNNMKAEYGNIWHAIEEANTNLNSAEKAATHKLKEVNDYSSILNAQKNKLHKDKESYLSDLANLKLQLNSNKELLQTHRNQMATWINDLTFKQQALDKLRERMDENDKATNIEIGLMFIPFIGTSTGDQVTGVSQVDLKAARGAAETAERILRNGEANVIEYSRRISFCEDQIKSKREEMHSVSAQLDNIVHDIVEVSRMSSVISSVQQNIMYACNILGQLAGNANAMEIHTKRFMFLEPLVLIFADIAQKMHQISGNEQYQLLQVNDVVPLVTHLKENLPKLKAICDQEIVA